MRCLMLLFLSPAFASAAPVQFEKDIRPILEARCVSCHGPDKQRGGLRLDRKADAQKGGDSGLAIQPGKSKDSLMLHRVTSASGTERMPPKGDPLTVAQIALLKEWIDAGAVWPDATATSGQPPHWSFQPLVRPAGNGIDAFILARLKTAGLSPSPLADKRTLIRRLSFDLCGLPPSPERIERFLQDDSPGAYDALVEEFLASSQFGERWARHWLDVVRFADSHGFEMNQVRPNAYHYRDYVIRSFNDDKPYDRFVREQIAGDSLMSPAAMGFLVAGAWDQVKSPDLVLTAQQRADELHDMAATTGSTFLGLTVGCARCHAHKFDPISQTDYYAIKAVFSGVKHGESAIDTQRTAADDVATLATVPGKPLPKQLRKAVSTGRNTDRFAPTDAKAIRFTIRKTTDLQPCIDELEAYTVGANPKNVALASEGAKAKASGSMTGNPIHQLSNIHDAKFGNSFSWISNENGKGWVTIEFAKIERIDRIVWSRDRTNPPRYFDRIANDYLIEVSIDGKAWQPVASSDDRDRGIGATLAYCGQFGKPEETFRLHRGDVTTPKEKVAPGVLATFANGFAIPEAATDSERRAAFANWIVAADNPLTSRVIVNRIWQHHFGTGLVDTSSDFGINGRSPSHPELLDWLATELIRQKWSLKAIHRAIVKSATYRQQSANRVEAIAKDAQSRMLWRYPPQRLEAEALRDSILAVSGKLDAKMYGPGFDLFQPDSNYVRVYTPKSEFGPETFRRMIYQIKPRMQLDDTFGAFDCPDGGQIAPKRSQSTTPLQALNLLNSPFVLQQSAFFAERLKKQHADEPARVAFAFALAFGRTPTRAESDAALSLIQSHGLPAFCRALFNANEFAFIR